MFKFQRNKCTEQTKGKIVSSRPGPNGSTVIYVRYEVDGTPYEVFETVKLTTKVKEVSVGKSVPVGQAPVPKLGTIEIGKRVLVNYNPNKHEMAYITDNVGVVDSIVNR